MKMVKRIVLALLVLLLTSSLFAAGQAERVGKPVVLKVSMAETSTDIKADIIKNMAAEIESGTNGRIKFEIYYSNELGSLADVTEQMVMGGNILGRDLR
jgi:TRAP-type C4-dicarboxylate transport system substrate-binding protein